jgi:glycerophosphoryl diester phosphodiesterase
MSPTKSPRTAPTKAKAATKATAPAKAKSSAQPTPAPDPAAMLRLAHRGDWRLARENSLEALVFAAGMDGVDGVEFDVRLAKDGVPVLLHDETLERVQGRDDAVGDLTAAELREAGIPTLELVLATLPAEAFLDVELKGPGHGAATADVLRAGRGKAPRRAVVSSFDEESLMAMGRLLPDWPRWLNSPDLGKDTVETATRHGCRAVAVQWRAITASSFKAARAAGLEVAAWTLTRPPSVERLAKLGVIAACVEGAALDG